MDELYAILGELSGTHPKLTAIRQSECLIPPSEQKPFRVMKSLPSDLITPPPNLKNLHLLNLLISIYK